MAESIQRVLSWTLEPLRAEGLPGAYSTFGRIEAAVGWLWAQGAFGTPHGAVCPQGRVAGYYCDWALCTERGGIAWLCQVEDDLRAAAEEALKAAGVDGTEASEAAASVAAAFKKAVVTLDEADRLRAMGGRFRRKLNKLAR